MLTVSSHHVMLYCERTSGSLWAEPFNTLSSIGFFVAAWLLGRLYRACEKPAQAAPLIIMTLLIGAGSAVFHSVATVWSVFFDVIPILMFVICYVYLFARILLSWNRLPSLALTLALAGINIVYKHYVPRAMDGYVSYIPTFMFLLVLTLILLLKRHQSALRMVSACVVALCALYLRMVDYDWCKTLPIGTHFLWHLLNAWLIYMLVRELILYPLLTRAQHHDGNS